MWLGERRGIHSEADRADDLNNDKGGVEHSPGVFWFQKRRMKCEFLPLGEGRGYGLRTELYPLEGPGHRGGHTLGPRMHSLHKTAAQLARHRTVPLPTMMGTLHCQPHCLELPRQHTSRRASEGFSREKELKDEKPLRPRVLLSSCLGPRLNKKEAKSVAVSIRLSASWPTVTQHGFSIQLSSAPGNPLTPGTK